MSDGSRGPAVRLDAGLVAGARNPGSPVESFKGIPFAAPPVGPRRWRPAGPVEPWSGTRPALAFGPAPLQSQPRRNTVMSATNFADHRELVMSEDCLYLNVWTPDSAGAGLPVMVWIGGGGNRFGWGSQDLYDGERLAARGVVVVTLNYRLGSLGFLAHPDLTRESPQQASGNYALTDLLAALRWVQANAAAFGGDPDRVTVCGNSAGSAHITHLMTSPEAEGLFSAAIGQSSAGFDSDHRPSVTLAEAEALGQEFVRAHGVTDVGELRTLAGSELIAGGSVGAIVDGWILPGDTRSAFEAGRQARIPLLVGNNADEGSVYAPRLSAAQFQAQAAELGPLREDYLRAYPAADDAQAHASARASVGDARMCWGTWKWAGLHRATSGQPVYLYRFAHQPPIPDGLPAAKDGAGAYGAYHTSELFYMWDNLSARDWAWTETDRRLADTMASAWVRFAAEHDPGGGSLGEWPVFSDDERGPVMYFADRSQLGPVPALGAMRVQDEIVAARRDRTGTVVAGG